jgi:hypothetical protein
MNDMKKNAPYSNTIRNQQQPTPPEPPKPEGEVLRKPLGVGKKRTRSIQEQLEADGAT